MYKTKASKVKAWTLRRLAHQATRLQIFCSVKKSIVQQLTMDNFESSSKVEAVVRHVKELAKTKGNKGIIFSQYNRMIDIVEWRLKDAGYNVVKLVGSMSLKQRGSVLNKFKTDPDIHIIIMSLKAGGKD